MPDKLARNEVKFMRYLASRHEALCSREEVVLAVYGEMYDRSDDERLDAMVGRIRRKIGDKGRPHRFLITVHGQGHRLLGYIDE
jgi:DNA-binding response OmpR family regulator